MGLLRFLSEHKKDVLDRWHALVREEIVPGALPTVELLDRMPAFVDGIVASLRGEKLPDNVPEEHGQQRLRLGFSLDSVVREYGALSRAIVESAEAAGETLTVAEQSTVFGAIIDGIRRAVSQYTDQRDLELVRQANEHLGFLAHELRNPLSSALMALRLLRDRGQLPSNLRVVDALERGLRRTAELIERTLEAARLSSGIELDKQPTTLAALFADAELGALPDALAKNIEIRTAIGKDATISLDVRLVSSAVCNLVRNAVKYTPPDRQVELRGKIVDGSAVIEVEDRCGGLPPGKVEAAFAPFVRLDSRETGFGLGLAIAKQAVDAHGGKLRVQNLPGRGCIFILELPLV